CNVAVSFIFFFSSRRRHTRRPRDLSSDVCSSDLRGRRPGPVSCEFDRSQRACRNERAGEISGGELQCAIDSRLEFQVSLRGRRRSEERRVGKECRSRWSPDDYIKEETEEKKGND